MITAPAAASWLAANTTAIAADEAAGQCFADIQRCIDEIERCINRPIPDQFCGTCTTRVETTICGLALYAPRVATEVTCSRCKATHNIEKLFAQTLDDSDDKSFTISELHRTVLPAVREYVPPRTLQHWAARGQLVPTGYNFDGEPRFMLADVRRLRDRKRQSVVTGAAAHSKNKRAS
jgi:hypothetical protein